MLTSPELLGTTEAQVPAHREQVYPPTVALSMSTRQVLDVDASCQKAVNGWAAQHAADGLNPCSVRTGGFCRAPVQMASTLTRETGCLHNRKARLQRLWRGRSVKLVDGTGISMPDPQENQACYPRPNTLAPGVGFPLARLVMVMCLATGAALDMTVGPHSGKGTGELARVRRLLQGFCPGAVMLADALYRNYFLITTLMGAALCARLWNVELDLRNLKTTTGMDGLNCQTPQMIEKQLWTEWVSRGMSATKGCWRLFALIAQRSVGNRPARMEPRMRKRRPKPYPWLKVSRAHARRKIKIHGHDWEPK